LMSSSTGLMVSKQDNSMQTIKNRYRHKIIALLNELQEMQLQEVYHFTVFIKNYKDSQVDRDDLPAVGIDHLNSLMGLTSIGGDAFQDSEDLYNA